MKNQFQVRPGTARDRTAIEALSGASPWFEHILQARFGRLENLFAEIGYPDRDASVYVCVNGTGALLGWACCFKFNQRAGYAGAAQLLLDALPGSGCAAGLVRACARDAHARGAHTLISFAHDAVPDSVEWHRRQEFEPCGEFQLVRAAPMLVFSRRTG